MQFAYVHEKRISASEQKIKKKFVFFFFLFIKLKRTCATFLSLNSPQFTVITLSTFALIFSSEAPQNRFPVFICEWIVHEPHWICMNVLTFLFSFDMNSKYAPTEGEEKKKKKKERQGM